ncbi:GD17721 [Drosophila simulans]|uniref:GD17721 n=1 Tax=Drosophila simulans TaxID=7240 RepID=B4NSV3_DROSI|nr:GD17721 [Drosophila simulans]
MGSSKRTIGGRCSGSRLQRTARSNERPSENDGGCWKFDVTKRLAGRTIVERCHGSSLVCSGRCQQVRVDYKRGKGSSRTARLLTDKQVGNEIGDLYDQPSTSHQAAIAAAKRDAASAGTTSSVKKAQSKPPPIVMEGVDDVCLMMQSIESIVDLEKVEARASMSGALRLYAARDRRV